jgi:integrase/recombinase XerD
MSQRLATILEDWIEEFISDMNRRGYSERSRKGYRYDLLLFVAWIVEQPELNEPGDLTQQALEQYQMHLMLRSSLKTKYRQPRTMTAGSRNRHLAELRTFFRFLKKTCRLLSNPSAELERTREPKRLPKAILSVPEMGRLLQIIPKSDPVGLRDWATIELLYGTGMRRMELIQLSLTDLRLEEGLVHIFGKGSRERIVPLGKAAQKALERYLREGRPQLTDGKTQKVLVSAFHGGPAHDKELAKNILGHARNAGIKKAISFHVFRHTMATHLLRGGADLRSIQTMLGHSQLNTTAIYTRVEVSDLQKTIQRCHPREQR